MQRGAPLKTFLYTLHCSVLHPFFCSRPPFFHQRLYRRGLPIHRSGQLFPNLARLSCARLSSLVSLSAAVSAVSMRLRPALLPLQAQLLRPAQALRGHCVSALGEAAASSPKDVSPGQPAVFFQSSLERKAVGSAGYRTWSGTNGCPVHGSPDGGGIIA